MSKATGKDRWWIVGGIAAAVVLIAASWFFLIGPKLDDAGSVRSQTEAAADQNSVLQIKVNKLRADSAGMPDLLKQLDTLHTQLPTSSGLDDLTRQLTAQAAAAKVTMTSIVIGAPTVVKSASAKKTAKSTSETDGSDSGTTDSGNASADGADGSTTATTEKAAQLNLYAIPVTISADGPIANQQELLDAIQTQGPRGALVSSVQFSPAPDAAPSAGGEPAEGQDPGHAATAGSGAGPATMTVQLTVFVAPQSPDDEAALRKQLGG